MPHREYFTNVIQMMVPYDRFHIFNFCQFYVFNKGLGGHVVQTRLVQNAQKC